AKCHSLGEQKISLGPQLSDIGLRTAAKHLVASMVVPDAHITEGFSQLVVETTEGAIHSGVLVEESGLALTIGLPTAERLVLRKEQIESRRTTKRSAMPSFAQSLTPPQVADIAAFLLTQKRRPAVKTKPAPPAVDSPPRVLQPKLEAGTKFGLALKSDRLTITHSNRPLADFVFHDPSVLRPYFANVHGPRGAKITRNHPPIPGRDATDHGTMHPGIWLGFGDISGVDFWRNQGRIEHVRFVAAPTATKQGVTFATESRLASPTGKPLATLTGRCTLSVRPAGWLLIWDATFHAGNREITFGDQEEMGFGARLATELTEKNGGIILNSRGTKTAKETWGKPAAWCDYSGVKDGRRTGILLMASPKNFRQSWWHNRDYGVFVANPFGRAAMKQGAKSQVLVKQGQSLRLVFAALLHDAAEFDPAVEYRHLLEVLKSNR
ncbi:MAG: DUF6807 family protein, partial [Pirellulales bacterium]